VLAPDRDPLGQAVGRLRAPSSEEAFGRRMIFVHRPGRLPGNRTRFSSDPTIRLATVAGAIQLQTERNSVERPPGRQYSGPVVPTAKTAQSKFEGTEHFDPDTVDQSRTGYLRLPS